MLKLAWQMITCLEKLWVIIMKAKYVCGLNMIPEISYQSNSSITWRAIVDAWQIAKLQLIWVSRDGQTIKFWKDSWISRLAACVIMWEPQFLMGRWTSQSCFMLVMVSGGGTTFHSYYLSIFVKSLLSSNLPHKES